MIADLARCVKNVMNIKEGLHAVIAYTCDDTNSVSILARTLDYVNVVTQALIVQVLAAVALMDGEGHA